MRKSIAKLLVRLADKIYPEKVARVPKLEHFKSGKLGLAQVISNDELKKIREQRKLGQSDAVSYVISSAKESIYEAICNSIKKEGLIQYKVNFTKGGVNVEGFMRVYLKDDGKAQRNKSEG